MVEVTDAVAQRLASLDATLEQGTEGIYAAPPRKTPVHRLGEISGPLCYTRGETPYRTLSLSKGLLRALETAIKSG